jgi:DNA-binding CsgD family transcriptional regulator
LQPAHLPVLHLSSSVGVADTTHQCFAAYLEGLYRRDRSFETVRPGHAAVLRMHADEAPNQDHREAIYLRHGMLERLSVVQRASDSGGRLLAVNLYRHQHQGRFGEAELAGFTELAPLLLAAVQRHLSLAPIKPASPRETLQRRCAALTERELDVCERLLRGWSYDGIAADLGLSLATVKTYRARAFERLGLHFKSELFAACRPLG